MNKLKHRWRDLGDFATEDEAWADIVQAEPGATRRSTCHTWDAWRFTLVVLPAPLELPLDEVKK